MWLALLSEEFMRELIALVGLTGALFVLPACQDGAVFDRISSVRVRHIGPKGLMNKKLSEDKQRQLVNCLYTSKEIQEDKDQPLLQTTYLLEINDHFGDRSFELYTRQNLKGNRGRYYLNTCVYPIIAK